jgi:hypothetical protein
MFASVNMAELLAREVTTVRTICTKALALKRGTRKIRCRRARLRHSAIEPLEARGLLSAAVPYSSGPLALPDADRRADISRVFSLPREDEHGSPLEASVVSRSSDSAHAVRVSDPGALARGSAGRTGSNASGAFRRLTYDDDSQREIAGSLGSGQRNASIALGATAGDPPTTEPELIFGVGASEPSESAVLASVIAWAPDPAMSGAGSAAGRISGFDSRMGTGSWALAPTVVWPGSSRRTGPRLDASRAIRVDSRSASEILGDRPGAKTASVAASESGSPMSNLADLLDGVIRLDWEAVDGELRQFLARLGACVDDSNASGSASPWPIWIAAATAVLVARRVSPGTRRFRAECITEQASRRGHRRAPVGPWPLGSP